MDQLLKKFVRKCWFLQLLKETAHGLQCSHLGFFFFFGCFYNCMFFTAEISYSWILKIFNSLLNISSLQRKMLSEVFLVFVHITNDLISIYCWRTAIIFWKNILPLNSQQFCSVDNWQAIRKPFLGHSEKCEIIT